MSQKGPDRTPRILRIVGWVIGLYGILMLADDVLGGSPDNNLFAIVFVVAGIATLVYARQRESALTSGDDASPAPGDESRAGAKKPATPGSDDSGGIDKP